MRREDKPLKSLPKDGPLLVCALRDRVIWRFKDDLNFEAAENPVQALGIMTGRVFSLIHTR